MSGIAYDELLRMVREGETDLTPERCASFGVEKPDVELFAAMDAADTILNVLPKLVEVEGSFVRIDGKLITLLDDELASVLATHTATGIMLGLGLAKAVRGR